MNVRFSPKWESITEIHRRTGAAVVDICASIQSNLRRTIRHRVLEVGGVQVAQFRLIHKIPSRMGRFNREKA